MATPILTSFSCWATLAGDRLQHFDIAAADHAAAVLAGFARFPRASSMSCRPSGAGEERLHG